MKVGYPDTINNKAYKQVSPLKARYTRSGEGEDLKAVEIEKGSLAKKEDPPTSTCLSLPPCLLSLPPFLLHQVEHG